LSISISHMYVYTIHLFNREQIAVCTIPKRDLLFYLLENTHFITTTMDNNKKSLLFLVKTGPFIQATNLISGNILNTVIKNKEVVVSKEDIRFSDTEFTQPFSKNFTKEQIYGIMNKLGLII